MRDPEFTTINEWCRLTGMSRTGTYDALARGVLHAVKLNGRTLINAARGLEWMRSLPAATVSATRKLSADLGQSKVAA